MNAVVAMVLCCCGASAGAAAARLPIGAGNFSSVLPTAVADKTTHVSAFRMDQRPITNAEFLSFILQHPEWRRHRVATLFGDSDYLSHWAAADRLGLAAEPEQPVTRVSWFAARAYCQAAGGRLPNWSEWELVAAADETTPDARHDAGWRERILTWYGQPASRALGRVGLSPANFYGIQDLHGLVWEWVEDFNALLVASDSRDQGDPDKLKFCGAGAISLEDRDNYAVLMRIAFLSALEARSTAHSLGFRCASGDSP